MCTKTPLDALAFLANVNARRLHVRASMKMERFFSENGTDVSRTIKTNHIVFL